jgi:DNA-directed RNA polymerase subunit omega
MIVKPTVNELLEHAENRFALVIGTSKRARQIADGEERLTDVEDKSPVTVAANEINEGKVVILSNSENNEMSANVEEQKNNFDENEE